LLSFFGIINAATQDTSKYLGYVVTSPVATGGFGGLSPVADLGFGPQPNCSVNQLIECTSCAVVPFWDTNFGSRGFWDVSSFSACILFMQVD